MVIIVGAVFLLMFSMEMIIQDSPLAVYQIYLGHSDSYGSKLSVLLAIILIPTIMVRAKKIGVIGMIDICLMALVLQIISLVSFNNTVLSRMTDYFSILLIFVAPLFKYLFDNKSMGNMAIYTAFAGIFLFYLINTMEADVVNQGLATSPFVPYQFIFGQ